MTRDQRRIWVLKVACCALFVTGCDSDDPPARDAGSDAASAVAPPVDAGRAHDAASSVVMPRADAASDSAGSAYTGPPRWTILVYLAADNNLEGSAIDDLREMLSASVGPNVHVLLEVDRSPGFYELGIGNLATWETVKRLEVRDHTLVEVADLGELNTGEPEALSDFIRWGLGAYPAERRVLILWNHGNAWRGWGSDDTQDHDLLDDAEIGRAIKAGMQAAGQAQLDLIGFDACLMSSLETARMIAPFTRYLVASEELEPSHGWDYTRLLDAVNERPSISIPDLGASIVQGFSSQARAHGKQRVVTLNTLDLSQLGAVDSALTQLISAIDVALSAKRTALAYALEHAQRFGDHADPARAFHLVDLGDFSTQLTAHDASFAAPSNALRTALAQLVLSSYYGSERRGSSGLSVYFPQRHSNYLLQFDAVESSMQWRELLRKFHALVAAPDSPAPKLDGHGAHQDNQSDPEIHEHTAQDTFVNARDLAAAQVSCKAGQGPELTAHTASASEVSDAWLYAGAEQAATHQVDVFMRKQASVHEDGTLAEVWDRHVLVAQQGQHQRLLFSEAKIASDDPRYVVATVPLLYTAEAPADLDHPGLRCACAQPGEPGYSDLDADAHPDCADADLDGDGVPDKLLDETLRCPRKDEEGCPTPPKLDNCAYTPNADQKDSNGNGVGDVCDDGKAHAPQLACRPAPTGPLTQASAAWWFVTIDRLAAQEVDATLYIAGPDGASEAKPGPEAVLWLDIPHVGKTAALEWDDEVPLPFSFGQPIHFKYLELNELVVLESSGDPKLDDDGHAQSLLSQLGYSQVYLALAIEDYAGRSDSAAVMIGLADCTPCHDQVELEDELSEGAKPRCYDPCPAADDEPDCAGTCIDSHLLAPNGRCDDGTQNRPDLDCKRFDFDHRECLAPECPDGFLRDCHGACTAADSPSTHQPRLGDKTCHAWLDCSELSYDLGDCVCAHACSGHGTCTAQGDQCSCASGFAGDECQIALPKCGDTSCDLMQNETCVSCPADCGECVNRCGDGTCEPHAGEDCTHCPADCGACRCGDHECSVNVEDLANGENCHSCSEDCGACPVCGDLECQAFRSHAPFSASEAESCALCPGDCGICVGDCCTSSTAQMDSFEGGGCGDQPVAQCVCKAHPECCRSGWGDSCVSYARNECGLPCSDPNAH